MNSRWIAAAVIAAVILAVFYLMSVIRSRPVKIADLPFPEQMQRFADEAVSIASDTWDAHFDYTDESIIEVETTLEHLHVMYKENRLPENQLNGAAVMNGAYIGELIRRNHGGEWLTDEESLKSGAYAIEFDGNRAFPVGWCVKRIQNGIEDNVQGKYEFFVVHAGDLESIRKHRAQLREKLGESEEGSASLDD
ncbi:MAG: hypothetical protein AAGI54_02410 [Planctomycetota bacterium]